MNKGGRGHSLVIEVLTELAAAALIWLLLVDCAVGVVAAYLEGTGLQKLTFYAKRSEQSDSFGEIGFKFTIMRTFAVSLDSCCCKQNVSFEFLYGTCFD